MIRCKSISKIYKTKDYHIIANRNINLEIKDGEIVWVAGVSGAGKSTLLHMIGGLDIPSEGTVIVDDIDLSKMNNEQMAIFRRRKVGFVFQQYNLIPDLNVYENVVFPLQLDGRHIDDEFIETILTTLKIADKKEALPSMLSGGQQQRVAIARALATKPAIILADELTGNLDTTTSHEVMLLLKILAKQYQQTIVIITHDYDIAQLANRIIQIEDGKIVQGSDDNA